MITCDLCGHTIETRKDIVLVPIEFASHNTKDMCKSCNVKFKTEINKINFESIKKKKIDTKEVLEDLKILPGVVGVNHG